ncbi:MAG: transporter substrate-binding domain-containing protein [Pseudomonadota bacterium]
MRSCLCFSFQVSAWLMLVLAIWAWPDAGRAQDQPLTYGVVESTSFTFGDSAGTVGGFAGTVMERLAEIMEIEVRQRVFLDIGTAMAALEASEIAFLAGVPRPTGPDVVFSTAVAESQLRLFVRDDRLQDRDFTQPRGKRLGVITPFPDTDLPEILSGNTVVVVPSLEVLLTRLLTGDLDGVVLPEHLKLSLTYAARIDHRIGAVGSQLRTVELGIALGPTHSDLLSALNSAITILDKGGELLDLRRRHFFVDVGAYEPKEVLKVGVSTFPPYNVVEEDGSFTGFSVETLRDIAALAGVEVEFVELTLDEWAAGPAEGTYDMVTQVAINPERRTRMDFTAPIERAPASIFVPSGQESGITGLNDLMGLRVGVQAVNSARRILERDGRFDLAIYETDHEDLLRALLAGEVDAIVYPTNAMQDAARSLGVLNQIVAIDPPALFTERAIALRFGLGAVRERLNAIIPGYLASADYFALRAQWFQPPPFWTDQRLTLTFQIATITLAFILGVVGWVLYRSHLADARRRVASELIDHIPLGLVLISPDGRIMYTNSDARARVVDGDRVLARGRAYREAIRELIENGVIRLGGRTKEGMLDYMTSDGLEDGFRDEYQFQTGSTVVRTTRRLKGGETLLMRQDITEERLRLEQIQVLNTSLEEQILQAKAANDDLRAFAYATSHDLKSPTNTALMLLDALKEELGADVGQIERTLASQLQQTIERMQELIDDVLVYTNVVGTTSAGEPVELNELAAMCIADLQADITAAGARIEVGDLPCVRANPAHMRQLLANLVSNAVKFRAPGRPPVITISSVDALDGFVGFSVSDNGIGIPEEYQEKIFQMFQRLNPEREYYGTGLGLAICHRIALNLGGRISVSSQLDKGATFTVILKGERNDRALDAH